MRNRIAMHLVFALILLSAPINYLVFGYSLPLIQNIWINRLLFLLIFLFGVKQLAFGLFGLLLYKNYNPDIEAAENTRKEHIPKYGYKDQWERENL